jgi:tRNA-dihydrouridine synthase
VIPPTAKKLTLKSGLTLPHSIFPGPMEGVMNPLFCKAAEELNLTDFWITPFLRITTGPVSKKKIKHFILPFSQHRKPVILQLMGTSPALMIETAHRAEELGIAGVNFNLACPSKQVTGGGCGGALLKNHTFIKELMLLSENLPKEFSVSLKIRTGLQSPDELPVIAASIKSGRTPDFVVIHYRTVEEGYRKVNGRIERLQKAVKLFKEIPVIGNGDIQSAEDAEKVIADTDCQGVMVARGWLKNLNLIRDILKGKESSVKDKDIIFSKFVKIMAENISHDNRKKTRNSIIELTRYAYGITHPLFLKIINKN